MIKAASDTLTVRQAHCHTVPMSCDHRPNAAAFKPIGHNRIHLGHHVTPGFLSQGCGNGRALSTPTPTIVSLCSEPAINSLMWVWTGPLIKPMFLYPLIYHLLPLKLPAGVFIRCSSILKMANTEIHCRVKWDGRRHLLPAAGTPAYDTSTAQSKIGKME